MHSGDAGATLFAHRGASKAYPEHTRAAYLEAIAQGADGLETDVRMTADGALVCWHDATTDRTTATSALVQDLTLDEMRALDLSRGAVIPDDRGGTDQLMTLESLLALMLEAGRPLRLALEIKQPSHARARLDEAVLAALDNAGWQRTTGQLESVQIDLMCFWPQTVDALRSALGSDLVMLLLDDAERDELVAWVQHETGGVLSGQAAIDAIDEADSVRQRLIDESSVGLGPGKAMVKANPELVRFWAEQRLVRVWTVDKPADARLCLELGVRELTTNRPGELRAALASG